MEEGPLLAYMTYYSINKMTAQIKRNMYRLFIFNKYIYLFTYICM